MNNTPLTWGQKYNDGRQSQERLDLILSDLNGLPIPNNPTAMDLGANTGFFSYGLAAAGFDVVAVEPPNDNKVFDLTRISEHRQWVHYRDDLPEGPFDVSLVLSVLHHIPAWKSVLNGVRERTRVAVYVEVPHHKESHYLWHGALPSLEYVRDLPGSRLVGEHFEVSGRHRRPMYRIV